MDTVMGQGVELALPDALRALFRDCVYSPLPFDLAHGTPAPSDALQLTASVALDPALAAQVLHSLAACGTALAVAFEGLWGLVLCRASGQAEASFWVTEREAQLPVRCQLDGASAFDVWLRAYEAQRRLVSEAGAASRAQLTLPLIESSVAVGEQPLAAGPCPLRVELQLRQLQPVQLSVVGDARRFDRAALEQLCAQLEVGLRLIAQDPGRACKDLILSTDQDRALSVARCPDSEVSVPTLFREQVALQPDAVAVRGSDSALTYRELDARSDRLAQLLLAHGVRRDDTVALCVERAPELIVALLAILKAGGAYLPIEQGYPRARIAFMLEDARPRALITQASLRALFPATLACPYLDLERLPESSGSRPFPEPAPEDLAYVLYTSGSTGNPKGVEVPHRAIERLVKNATFARLDRTTTILQAAPVAFDASTLEIWGPLLNGGCVALHTEAIPTAKGLGRAIQEHRVTTMWLTAALFNTVIDEDASVLRGLRQLLTGGEALSVPHVRRALAALPETELINGYGPTETTTFATCYAIPRALPDTLKSIPIGSAIRDTQLHVLDPEQRPLPCGWVGELYIGGRGVARGYLNRPELNAERFLPDPEAPGARLYRTGDLVRRRLDGALEYVGRADQQVKIRGFRIELGEIENALMQLPAVQSAVVVARTTGAGDKQLVGYGVRDAAAREQTPQEIRHALAQLLPEYMVPSAFIWLAELPKTLNGKVDVRALPEPGRERPELAVEYVAPRSALEERLAQLWAAALDLKSVGVLDNLFDLGANSLLVVRTVARLEREHGLVIPAVRVFEKPTIAALAQSLEPRAPGARAARVRSARSHSLTQGVAIVGMAGRFPGAPTVEALWQNLCDGKESIAFFADAQLDPQLARELVNDPAYVKARGVLEGVELFDAAFFGITPKEAQLMDPQQRVLLEVAWETLEDAGYDVERYPGTIGVFAGKYNNSYYEQNVLGHPELIAELGAFQTMVANEKDYIATRIAHRLGLRGPAISVHTACSTSLVAVAQAFQNLLFGQCDMALAGGVSITVPVKSGYLYQEGAMLSPDGHTRSFDARASGTVFSDGAAMVLLKRLDDALADGDRIYGVIRGAATNNDGNDKASFTAPSSEGQAAVIALAQAQAGVSARDISYVEAHGTATPLGDPIEVEALTRAFREATNETQFCALGSIKSNLGHLVIAAGAAGLIKTVLSLRARQLVPSLHFEQPNPKIDFANSPFVVNRTLRPWPDTGKPRLAGVSSFGVGGTNAHVVVEEPPQPSAAGSERAAELLVLSARSEPALKSAADHLAAYLERHPELPLADVAHTLRVGRKQFAQRRCVTAGSISEAIRALRGAEPRRTASAKLSGRIPGVAFMFPGQGAQYPGMGATLYRDYSVFREHVDHAATLLRETLGRDLRELLFPTLELEATAPALLAQTSFTQPALFVVGYALAQLWRSFGVEPAAMIGHSVGEFVCATLAGVMRLPDALSLVAARGQMMQAMPSGAMLSVRAPAQEVAPLLSAASSIASVNSPSLCVVAGPADELAALQPRLEARGAACRLLQTSHAFHSPMMEPVVPRLRALLEQVPLTKPCVPFVSSVTGTWITDAQACDPQYWATQVRLPVAFAAGVKQLLDTPDLVLLETGPRTTLATLARQQVSDRTKQLCLSSMADNDRDAGHALLSAAGQLWLQGVPLDPNGLSAAACRRVSLPTYPFERKRFWVDPARLAPSPAPQPTAAVTLPVSPLLPEVPMSSSRRAQIIATLKQLLEEASGLELSDGDLDASFVELGLDSLFLTQFSLALGRKFAEKITFRQLLEDLPTMTILAEHLESKLPPEAPAPASAPVVAAPAAPVVALPSAPLALPAVPLAAPGGVVQNLIEQQLRIMQQQLALLSGAQPMAAAAVSQPSVPVAAPAATEVGAPPPQAAAAAPAPSDEEPSGAMMKYDVKKAFGAIARITVTKTEDFTPRQKAKLEAFVRRYNDKTKGSKAFTQQHRSLVADPRVVTGFRPLTKELVYPIVVDHSQGSKLWDIDGNEYVDALNGFGLSLFGWQPEFVTKAVEAQLRRGHEIGPQHPLQAEVAELVCELTGFDRAAFCNTGSEAVMGCARIARTVTGRNKIAIFTGSYHGIFDEVVVRGTKKLRSIPAAPGIMPSTSENVLVLDYGTEESLQILKDRAQELAAIIVEPVQSRRPDFQPREFLHALRELTQREGVVLVFDEVVTGFRSGLGGAQQFFGVKADLASYGKVIGGGLPIGVIAGERRFMDALDGGQWEFGDDSTPPVGVTYFAGTFVRHPLALAAAKAVLTHLKEQGPGLQKTLNEKTALFAEDLNQFLEQVGAPIKIKHFASLWKTFYLADQPFGDLLFFMMRDRGIHIYDGFPCFYTTAHSDADFARISSAFKESVLEMQDAGFLPERKAPPKAAVLDANAPPVPGARLGRDPGGNPAWYVPHPSEPNKYVKLEVN